MSRGLYTVYRSTRLDSTAVACRERGSYPVGCVDGTHHAPPGGTGSASDDQLVDCSCESLNAAREVFAVGRPLFRVAPSIAMVKVLVTGSNGSVGRCAATALVEAGCVHVLVLHS